MPKQMDDAKLGYSLMFKESLISTETMFAGTKSMRSSTSSSPVEFIK